MNIAIFGGTGFLGKELVYYFRRQGHRVTVFSRDPKRHPFHPFSDVEVLPLDPSIHLGLESMDVVINLAGAGISRRWTARWKKKILNSRIDTTGAVVAALNRVKNKPGLFIQGSAIGYYPLSGDVACDENSGPGDSFLSEVVIQWEDAARELNKEIRQTVVRTGVVLSGKGGMLPRIAFSLRTFLGGIPGPGNNRVSWIHLEDFVRGIGFLVETQSLNGVFNFTSPGPVMMKDLIRSAAEVLKRPVLFRIPAILVKLALGEMGKEMVLGSQIVIPARLMKEGYQFLYPDIRKALKKELGP